MPVPPCILEAHSVFYFLGLQLENHLPAYKKDMNFGGYVWNGMVWMSVSPQVHMLNLNPQGDDIRR